ncbi:MAG TPA: S41 family peptidase [Rubrobacteraceae bacterium]|nr:S41 family peptidase [Rubrobacteraceae bacterium]
MWKSTAKRYGRRRAVTWVLMVVVLLLATALGAYTYGRSQSPAALEEQDRASLTLYAEALDAVREDYVDQEAIDPKKQTYGAIEGMLDTLGDEGHTRFLTPEEREQNREGLSGTYVGIGIQLEEEADEVVVAAPIEGSPAERAGIEAGDVVVAVDGESVRGEEVAQVAEKVRGPEGTRVELTVLRGGEEREFDLERAEIESPVASWTMIPSSDVAFVRLASFSDTSAEKLAQAFEEARAAGARRFVLDLRDNPGGRLDQAVQMSGNFLEAGSVVYVREDASGERKEVEVEGGTEPIDVPMAVLVNEGTASSSEILAGALRDNERATVIGETTFGTGTVLSEFVLRDGSAILLGVAEWLTPDGDFIRETGIEPDVEVGLAEDAEPLTPSEARDLSREEILDRDAQLARAFEDLQQQ